ETHHLQHEAAVQPIIAAEPIPPPDLTAVISEAAERGTNDQKDVVGKQKPKPRYTTPNRPRPKLTNSNKAPKTERSKAVTEPKALSSKCIRWLPPGIELVLPMPDLA